jgi:hypothetical protein
MAVLVELVEIPVILREVTVAVMAEMVAPLLGLG